MNEYLLFMIVFIYGIVIGSFLNVCIYRIPNGSSIVFGHSHCMNCNKKIKWYDLIPVFSFLLLRGRCRYCKSKISIQYPIIELLNGILYLLVFYILGWSWISVLYSFIVSALIVLSVIDYRTNTINLCINIFIFIMGVIVVLVKYYNTQDVSLFYNHIIGFFAVSSFLLLILILTRGKGMGMGDVNLMAASGLVLGWKLVILAFLIGCILATIIHPIKMKLKHSSNVLAFGPYLSGGIFISMLYGQQLINWYIQTFF